MLFICISHYVLQKLIIFTHINLISNKKTQFQRFQKLKIKDIVL